jgi:hypothetical protein
MQKPFHVGLGPHPMHLDIICSPVVTKEVATRHFPKFWADKYVGSGMMVDQSALLQQMNMLNYLVHVWSGCRNHSI